MSRSRVPDLLFDDEQEARLADLGELVERPELISATTPLHRLTVFLTYRCNLDCPYCKTIHLPRQRVFDDARFDALLAQHAGTPVRHLHFTGGEASLVPSLEAMVRRAKHAGVEQVSLTTNGTLPAEKYLALVRAGLDELRVSIDAADPTLGALLTGRPRAWTHAMDTLRALGQARREGVEFFLIVNTVVGVANRAGLAELVRTFLSLGVDDLKLITDVDARDTLGDFDAVHEVRRELAMAVGDAARQRARAEVASDEHVQCSAPAAATPGTHDHVQRSAPAATTPGTHDEHVQRSAPAATPETHDEHVQRSAPAATPETHDEHLQRTPGTHDEHVQCSAPAAATPGTHEHVQRSAPAATTPGTHDEHVQRSAPAATPETHEHVQRSAPAATPETHDHVQRSAPAATTPGTHDEHVQRSAPAAATPGTHDEHVQRSASAATPETHEHVQRSARTATPETHDEHVQRSAPAATPETHDEHLQRTPGTHDEHVQRSAPAATTPETHDHVQRSAPAATPETHDEHVQRSAPAATPETHDEHLQRTPGTHDEHVQRSAPAATTPGTHDEHVQRSAPAATPETHDEHLQRTPGTHDEHVQRSAPAATTPGTHDEHVQRSAPAATTPGTHDEHVQRSAPAATTPGTHDEHVQRSAPAAATPGTHDEHVQRSALAATAPATRGAHAKVSVPPTAEKAFPLLRKKLGTVFARDAIGLDDGPARVGWRCFVPLTERTVDGDAYYPCSVYLREGGAPLGPLTDSPELQRAKSASFTRDADCVTDPICRKYCLHCTRSWNDRVARTSLARWLAALDALAPTLRFQPTTNLIITPLGLPSRERILELLRALRLAPHARSPITRWSRVSTALQVRARDEVALSRAALFERLWRAHCPADVAEVWTFSREAHALLSANKHALRAELDNRRVDVPELTRPASLHALHLADAGDAEAEAARLHAARVLT